MEIIVEATKRFCRSTNKISIAAPIRKDFAEERKVLLGYIALDSLTIYQTLLGYPKENIRLIVKKMVMN